MVNMKRGKSIYYEITLEVKISYISSKHESRGSEEPSLRKKNEHLID